MRCKETKLVAVLLLAVLLLVYVNRGDLKLSNRKCECGQTTENIELIPIPKDVTSQQPKLTEPTPPRSNRSVQFIPKRIHQIFKDENIPEPYHEHILTWTANHPDWEYYFWTDNDAESMIFERYPQFVSLYKNYTYPLSKSDVMRYFILHQYGGVYADLDMKSIRPIGPFLGNHTSIVSPEPQVQTNLIFNLDKSLTNCIMASVPNHPFLMQVLNNLPKAFRKIRGNHDVLHSTGPFFLNKTYEEYTEHTDCEGKYCDVFVPSHKYLVPRFDVKDLKYNVNHICVQRDLGYLQRSACDRLTNTNYANLLPAEAVSDHYWLHLGWESEKRKNSKAGKKFETKNIRELVPNFISYIHR